MEENDNTNDLNSSSETLVEELEEYTDVTEEDMNTELTEDEILALLLELRKTSLQDEPIRDLAKSVERLCLNKQFDKVPNQSVFDRAFLTSGPSLQLLENLVLTWTSILTKNRPSVYAVPTSPSLENTIASKIATKLIEYIELEEDVNDKWHQTALWAAQHGTGFMKIHLNPATNRVEWIPLSLFDVYLENRNTPEQVEWVVIRSYINQYQARDMIKAVQPDENSLPPEVDYQDAQDITRKGVEKWEIWYKPSARYKDGLYACVVNNTVVEAMKYPYIFNDTDREEGKIAVLPVVWWTARRNRGATLGSTWANDCAPIQSIINNLFIKISQDALQARQILVLPAQLRNTDLIDEENARLFLDQANMGGADVIKWVSPAPVDQNIQIALQKHIESMYLTSGISQSTSGDAAASQSGKALAYQAQLDADKHSDAFKNFEKAQKYAWELTLRLVQKFYTAPRQLSITGENPITFMNTDISGVSIRLEPRSSSEGMASSKQEKARADMLQGFAGREALIEGAPSPVTEGMKLFAEGLINKYLAGEPVSITAETLPPEIMISVIDDFIHQALLAKDQETAEALNDLKINFLKSISGAQEAEAAPQQAEAPTNPTNPLPQSQPIESEQSVL